MMMMFSSLKKEAKKPKIEIFGCIVWRVERKSGILSLTEVTETQKVNYIESRTVYVCMCVRVCVCVCVCVCVYCMQV